MRSALLAILALTTASSFAACNVSSGAQTRALVELYTSEGCSSCPPADRWLSSLAARADPRVVPLAFHVGYWDYIGWKDRFADTRYTARQHDLAEAQGASMVYTPQVMIGGHDVRRWSDTGAVEEMLASIARMPAAARITVSSQPAGAQAIEGVARLEVAAPAKDVALYVALTQDGLASRVTAGENRGEHLRHPAVVRGLAEGAREVAFRFAAQPDWDPAKMSIVAFAQDARTGRVLQALSAPVCR